MMKTYLASQFHDIMVIMRILITGSRKWTDYNILHQAMLDATTGELTVTVITGGAKGADHLAEQIARVHGWTTEVHRADWEKHGKAAGPIRNSQMANETHPDIVLAFWDGKSSGTKDMIDKAIAKGLYTWVYREDGTFERYYRNSLGL